MKKVYSQILIIGICMLCSIVCFSQPKQTRVISGILKDAAGSPLPGVNIHIKETSVGVITDINGHYEIEAPVGSVLVYSFIGLKSKEVLVKPSSGNIPEAKTKSFHHTIPDDSDKTQSPYFFIKSEARKTDRLPLKKTTVVSQVSGAIANVRIRQLYVNTGESTLEAIYIFPGSTKSAVHGMSMQIGNRILKAKIKEKAAARETYDDAVQSGKTATLLEQMRPNVFQMNVGNILPGDSITVELKYTEILQAVAGEYQFVFPTIVGPRYSEPQEQVGKSENDWSYNPYLSEGVKNPSFFDFKLYLNGGLPIKKIRSLSHKLVIEYNDQSSAIVKLHSNGEANRDIIINYQLRGKQIESGLLIHEGKDENFFLWLMEPPERPKNDYSPPKEFIFIIDVSGSMSGTPLILAKKVLSELINDLRPIDKFNVMLFESSSRMMSDQSLAVNKKNLVEAQKFIDRQNGGGGTNLYSALKNALNLGKDKQYDSRSFIVLSDGYVTVEKKAFELIKENAAEAKLFTIGIGSSVNRYLLEGMAAAGNGEIFVINNEKEAGKTGKELFNYIQKPVLTEIRLSVAGAELYDIEPIQIPDLYLEKPLLIYGKFKKSDQLENTSITVTGKSGKSDFNQSISFNRASLKNNEGLKYLWARNKLINLSDYAYDATDNKIRKAKIVKLGLKYNLLTEHTSFVAVDSVIRRGGESQKVKQPLPVPEGVSDLAAAELIMEEDVESLEEVLVTGYTTNSCTKQSCGVSIVTYSQSANNINSRTNALQGVLPGVTINKNSGAPGPVTAIQIRGNTSVAGESKPLLIIDGVPVDNNSVTAERLSLINPENIESISVLKSISAMAIYGYRAAHGVILITTKSSKADHPDFYFKTAFELSSANKLPELQRSFAQGRSVNGVLAWRGAAENEIFSWGPAINQLSYNNQFDDFNNYGQLVNELGNRPAQSFNPYNLLNNGFALDYQVGYGNSIGKVKYDFSLGHTDETGVFEGSNYNRMNIKGSVLYQPKSKISVKLTGGYSNNQQNGIISGGSNSGVFYSMITTPPSFDNSRGFENNAFNNAEAFELSNGLTRSYNNGLTGNPYRSLMRNKNDHKSEEYFSNVHLKYSFSDQLKLEIISGVNQHRNSLLLGFAKNSAAHPMGNFIDQQDYSTDYNSSVLLTYQKKIADFDINVTTYYQHSFIKQKVDILEGSVLGNFNSFTSENAENSKILSNVFERNAHNLSSKIKTTYRNGLSINLGINNEWTTTLPQAENHLINTNAGISVLPFNYFGNIYTGFLTSLRLMGELNYSQKDAPFYLNPSFIAARDNEIGNFTAFYARRNFIPNNDLIPESVRGFEIGGEIALFDNSIYIDLAYFSTNSTDLFLPISDEDGFSLLNGGSLKNKGAEISLNYHLFIHQNLKWNINANFSFNRPVITSLPDQLERVPIGGFKSVSNNLIENQPYGVIYGSRYLRNDDGKVIIGEDGFPLADSIPGVIGNPNPDWTMAIENKLKYKNLTLTFLLEIKKGGDIWNGTSNTLNYLGTSKASGIERSTTGFIYDGVKTDGSVNDIPVNFYNPSAPFANNRWIRYGLEGVAEEAIEDGSWIRMRNVSLNYNLPEFSLHNIHFKNAELSLYARNLFLITKYSGVDPESRFAGYGNESGLDYFNSPSNRSFGISFKTEF